MADLITYDRALQAIPNATANDATTVFSLITAASAAIETYCHRVFISASYSQRLNGRGFDRFNLAQYPVTSLTRVATVRSKALEIENSTASASRASVSTSSTGLTLSLTDGGTTTTDTTVTWASNATITAVAAAVNALGSGWSATVVGNFGGWPSAELFDLQGPNACLDSPAGLVLFDEDLDDVRVIDSDAGILEGTFPFGYGNVLVEYVAGYAIADIPGDLQEACARLVATMFDRNTSETGGDNLKREKLGSYEYERFQDSSFWPDDVREMATPYRDTRL